MVERNYGGTRKKQVFSYEKKLYVAKKKLFSIFVSIVHLHVESILFVYTNILYSPRFRKIMAGKEKDGFNTENTAYGKNDFFQIFINAYL